MHMKVSALGIAAKILILSFGLIMLMNLSLIYVFKKVSDGTVFVKEQANTFELLQISSNVSDGMASMRYWLGDLATTLLNESESKAKQGKEAFEKGLSRLETVEPDLAKKLKINGDEFFKISLEAVDGYAQENRVLGNALMAKARDISVSMDKHMQEFLKSKNLDSEDAGKVAVTKVLENDERLINFGYILMALVTAVGTALAFALSRSITRPIKKIMQQLDEIGASNRDTSHRLMEASQKSTHSTSQQAAAIQETVASMAQMTSMLEQTAQYSKNANDMAYDVSRETTAGTVTMQKMASAMDVISSANSRLQDITKIIEDITRRTNVINDIVFKTQLLSVNASIEAARAGQHGKGFAVVANEVGNLANMSGKAANEIRNLLNDSRSQVSQIVGNTDDSIRAGQGVTHEAIKTFDKISKSMTVISERVGQINEATREQETGVKQTSMAMNQMNETTARNSSIARENASLSENLKHQSLKLTKIGSAMNFVVLGYQGEKKVKPKKISPIDALLGNDSEDEPSVSATRTSSKRSSSTIMSDTTDSENTSNHEGMSTGSTQSSFGDRKDGLIARLLKKADDFKSQQAKESRNSIDSSASEATQDDHKEMAHLTVVDMAHDKKSKKSKHNTDKSA